METSRTNVPSIADNPTRFASWTISESAQRRKAQIRKLVEELKVMRCTEMLAIAGPRAIRRRGSMEGGISHLSHEDAAPVSGLVE
jgi:hypothetical protein